MLAKSFKLNNGYSIPSLGLGTWKAEKGGAVSNAVSAALKAGYKHIDCAFIYDNEAEIGTVLKDCDRSNLFITSKLWNDRHSSVESALDETLKDLNLDYLDLYLIHWPISMDPVTRTNRIDLNQLKKTWSLMEEIVGKGKARSIGVSNFTIDHLKELLKDCKIKPQVNQVELHPFLPQEELVEFCKANDIVVTAYSPLGQGKKELLDEPLVVEIAKRNEKTPAQVLISWAIQRGTVVIPKSTNVARIESNAHVFELSSDDFTKLNSLGVKNKRFVDSMPWAKVDVFGTSKM